jgi:hypothetical protein
MPVMSPFYSARVRPILPPSRLIPTRLTRGAEREGPVGRARRVRWVAGIALVVVIPAAVACTASPASTGKAAGQATTAATAVGALARPSRTPSGSPAPKPTPTPRPKPKPKPRPRVVLSTVRTADGAVITVAVFRGPVSYVLHNGSVDPGYAASSLGVKAGPAIGTAERRHLLAAFNGGFKLVAAAGGYEQEGKVVSPLVKGDASFIIDADGRARIAVWGYGAPARGERVYSVRQNLGLLVEAGKPVALAADWWDWGGTVGGSAVARSAVGMDSAGDIIYAASMSALPEDLAVALADRGARIGMELDINPDWVQLDVAARPGGPLRTAVPGQWRAADQFTLGWTRDFFTVLG